jgi:competence protein ComEA
MNEIGSTARARRRLAWVCLAALLVAPGAAQLTAADDGAQSGETKQKIDINKATAEQLTAIPGVGPTLAQRIVDFREKQGRFRRVEDLLKIKGIGEKSFQKIRPWVKVVDAS